MPRFDGSIVVYPAWPAFKAIVASKRMLPQCEELFDRFEVFAIDDRIVYRVTLQKDTAEAEECASIMDTMNLPIGQRLATGVQAQAIVAVPAWASPLKKSWRMILAPSSMSIVDIYVGDALVGPRGVCLLIAGGYKFRTPAIDGTALHFALVDRDDLSGAFVPFGLQRTRLTGLSNVTGTINVGDVVAGVTSERHARVLAVVDTATVDVTYHDGPFADGEALSFTGGATATLGAWVEGDVYEINRFVRDEYVEGMEEDRTESTGGALPVPAGFYFRVIAYNPDTDAHRVKVTLTVAVG